MAESLRSLVYVRNVENEEDITISLLINGKQRNMKRSKQEPLKKVLQRIAINHAEKKSEGKKKRKTHVVSENGTDIKINCGGDTVSGDTPNCYAWLEKNILTIGNTEYAIVINPPTVLGVNISACCMAGYPIIPECQLEFADQCNWAWYFENTKLCSKHVYVPTHVHVGHCLRVSCTPISKDGICGVTIEKTTPKIVTGLAACLSDSRYQFTPAIQEKNMFRILSYNILADYYATQQYSRDVLYPYCKPEALEVAYRQCLLGKELPSYHADIMCLQEVGVRCYASYLRPLMDACGYCGCFHKKFGQAPEGEAIFYQASKLTLVKECAISLAEFLKHDDVNVDLFQQLKCSKSLIQSLLTKSSLCQVVLLRNRTRTNHVFAVANTHLISHPLADHLRIIQTELCLRYLNKVIVEFKHLEDQGTDVLPIFCGDFNSCPEFAVYEYVLKGSISSTHPDWLAHRHYEKLVAEKKQLKEAGKLSENETCLEDSDDILGHVNQQTAIEQRKEGMRSTADKFDDFPGIELRHSFNFINGTGLPAYTNYTAGFSGILDYIFVDKSKVKVDHFLPLPSHSSVVKHVALPSVEHPSDHLAIACDITLF